jgi:biopolymer transport protein ExbD
VVQVLKMNGAVPAYKINETDVYNGVGGPQAVKELQQRLTEIYANRAERIMFVKGDDNVDFRYVAEVIDIGREANVDHVGLMTPKIMAGE